MKGSVEIIQYEPIHAMMILERNVREQELWLTKYPDWEKTLYGWRNQGPAYTLVIDGEVIGCAGVVILSKHKGEAWMLLSTLFYSHLKTTFKEVKTRLDRIIEVYDLWRVQSLITPDKYENKRFIEHLGFLNETPTGMKMYGPNGETLLLYSKVKEV